MAISSGESNTRAARVGARLVGEALPSIDVVNFERVPDRFYRYAVGWAVMYFYVGALPGESTLPEDMALHAGFIHHHEDLKAVGAFTVGVSAEFPDVQARRWAAAKIEHEFVSDPHMYLAELLRLPVNHGARASYRRLVLIVRDGVVVRVFYPLCDPARVASQTVAWMRING